MVQETMQVPGEGQDQGQDPIIELFNLEMVMEMNIVMTMKQLYKKLIKILQGFGASFKN